MVERNHTALQPALDSAGGKPQGTSESRKAAKSRDDLGGDGKAFSHDSGIRFRRILVKGQTVRRRLHTRPMNVTDALRRLRERAGLTMAEMAKFAGWRQASSYQRYEDPAIFKKSRLHPEVAERFARALVGKGSPPISLAEVMALAASAQASTILDAPLMRRVEVVGVVEAGAWRETWENPKEDRSVYPMPPFPGFDRIDVLALEVRGPSMNERYPEGCVVFFVRASDMPPVAGNDVVVIRQRAGLVEATLKEYGEEPRTNRVVLRPRSRDPRYQEPLYPDQASGGDVEIIGVVIGKFELVQQPPAARKPR